ncbi:MAG TPA: DUF4148 domain-containing protein [Ramlibacter sp.]|nr:DUF4148 domain-containing protein [Ramlibacter sp.]
MNRKLAFILVLAAAAAGNAFADDITIDTTPFVSTKSRAQVQAELKQFQQSGSDPWAMQYDPLARFTSSRSRAQVEAEYLASRQEVAAMTGEDSGSAYLARNESVAGHATRLAGHPRNPQ